MPKNIFKKIFKKNPKIIEKPNKVLKNVNSTKKNIPKEDSEDSSGFNFRDGFNTIQDMKKNENNKFKKRMNLEEEENSGQETLKNPDSKNSKLEEIYSDFTHKPFKKNKRQIETEEAETIQTSNTVLTINTEVDGVQTNNKIIKSVKKNSKGFSSRNI